MKTHNTFWVLGHRVTAAVTTGDYDLVEIEVPANTPGPPPHLHLKFTEFFQVTEGEVEFLLNGESKALKAGASVDIPPGSIHSFRNASSAGCKMVNVHSPQGFVDFFKTVGVPAASAQAQEDSVSHETIEQVIAIANQFDIQFQEVEA